MFTGLIEALGDVLDINKSAHGCRQIKIGCRSDFAAMLKAGDSVAVMGVCLTVTKPDKGAFTAQMMDETVELSTLGKIKAGQKVNLERALAVTGRLDGHMVQGHAEGVGVLEKIDERGKVRYAHFSAPDDLAPFIVKKGSIAIDGVSLTVIDKNSKNFTVGLIPATLDNTTLKYLKIGGSVNLETDIIGRYVFNFISAKSSENNVNNGSALSAQRLAEYGFM